MWTISARGLVAGFAVLLFAGASAVPVSAGNADVVGTWNLEFNDGTDTVHPTLTLEEKAGALAGKWSGPRGTAELKDAKYADGALTFNFDQKMVMREINFVFKGKVDGGKVAGTLTTPRGDMAVTGVKAP